MKNRLQVFKNKKVIVCLVVSLLLITGCISIAVAASNNGKESSKNKQSGTVQIAAKEENEVDSGKKKDTSLSGDEKDTTKEENGTEDNTDTDSGNGVSDETKNSQSSAQPQSSTGSQSSVQPQSTGVAQGSTEAQSSGTVQGSTQTPGSGTSQGNTQTSGSTPSSGGGNNQGGSQSSNQNSGGQTVTTPTVCQHSSSTRKVTVAATATTNGTWERICNNCGASLESGSIHAYSAYAVDLGGGKTATVYGYYDDAVANEIFRQLNEYRVANGLPAEGKDDKIVNAAKIRAVEIAYYPSHDRPNGSRWFTIDDRSIGENISSALYSFNETSQAVATSFMSGWKSSSGHNRNMLHEDPEPIVGIGVFVRMDIGADGVAEIGGCFGVQDFGSNEEINWDF